jgi:hypothetical protein
MFNSELTSAVENFAAFMLPLSEKDLERKWEWKDHDEEGIRFAFFVTIQELRDLAVGLAASRKPLTQTQHILGQYHAQYMDLHAALFGLSAEDAGHVPVVGEWPVQHVYAHILDADINFSAVVRYALEGHRAGTWKPEKIPDKEEARLTGMSEEQYHTLTHGSLEGMLTYYRELHPGLIEEFSTITDKELDLPSIFWEKTIFPIRHRLLRYEAHIVQHTVQIDKTLVAIGETPGESKRLIRYLYAALAEVDKYLIGGEASSKDCAELVKTIEARVKELRLSLK